jgi:hypothetical protein
MAIATLSRDEIQQEALSRAATGQSLTNWPATFAGFMAKGIPEHEIRPRENVFTYHAWRALGRQVLCEHRGTPGHHGFFWEETTRRRFLWQRTALDRCQPARHRQRHRATSPWRRCCSRRGSGIRTPVVSGPPGRGSAGDARQRAATC